MNHPTGCLGVRSGLGARFCRFARVIRMALLLLMAAAVFSCAKGPKKKTVPEGEAVADGSGSTQKTAAKLVGAAALIQKIVDETEPKKEAKKAPETAGEKLAVEIETFRKEWAGLDSETAASRWLALWAAHFALPGEERSRSRGYHGSYPGPGDDFSLAAVFKAIPGPATWPHLARLVEQQKDPKESERMREAALRMVIAFLNGDLDKARKQVEAMTSFVSDAHPYARENLRHTTERIVQILEPGESGTKAGLVESFEQSIKLLDQQKGRKATLKIPDLLALTDRSRAEALIVRVLRIPKVRVAVPSGGATKDLVKQLALTHLKKLKDPPWYLVDSIKDVALFEAIDKAFPAAVKKKEKPLQTTRFIENRYGYDDPENELEEARGEALSYYLVGLVAQDRADQAMALLLDLEPGRMGSHSIGYALVRVNLVDLSDKLFAFTDEVLKKKNIPSLLGSYMALGLASGKTEQMLATFKRLVEDEKLPVKDRVSIRQSYARALLAVDRIDEGIGMWKAVADMVFDPSNRPDEYSWLRNSIVAQYVTLGKLLERDDLLGEGIALARKIAESESDSPGYGWRENTLCSLYLEGEKYGEAEACASEAIVRKIKAYKRQGRGYGPVEANRELGILIEVYDKTDRPEDLLLLLDRAPWWGTIDLIGLPGAVKLSAAGALHALGRDEEARGLLKNVIIEDRNRDDAYRLLSEIEGLPLIEWLDDIYRFNRFEERPLIWKAHLLEQAGRLKEAEAVIGKALTVDPTDGEQSAGERVFAYEVWAKILDGLKKPDKAAFVRNVVGSVRTAEHGDKLTEAGLIKRSVATYKKAEGLFSDAYCVQWRLAERLQAMGQFKEAEAHYKIVFEKMPEQFGRAASFCFGCEGVFQKKHSLRVAEKVLTGLLKTEGKRPQVHYMLGMLREAQGRYTEAHMSFRMAVTLDPEYYDALNKMQSLSDTLFLPKAEREEIAWALFRLRPNAGGGSSHAQNTVNVKRVWDEYARVQNLTLAAPSALLPLSGARARFLEQGPEVLEQMEKAMGEHAERYRLSYGVMRPGEAIAAHAVVQVGIQLMGRSGY